MDKNQTNVAAPIQTNREQEDTIDLVEIFYLFFGHLWQIILLAVLGGILAFAATYFLITPQYQSSAKLYIVSASNDSVVNLSDLQIGTQLTSDYQELLLSRPLLEDVSRNLNLGMSPSALAGMITVTNTKGTRILNVTVTSTDPQQAADIANELVTQACIYLPRIMETESPNVVESAVVPTHKSSPSITKNTLLGAVLMAVLYCAILLVRHLMNDTLVTPEDVERYFGVRPLAAIPEGDFDNNHGKKGRKRRKKEARV